jgi:hypothetical protein
MSILLCKRWCVELWVMNRDGVATQHKGSCHVSNSLCALCWQVIELLHTCFQELQMQSMKYVSHIIVTVQGHFIAYCRCREAVKLIRLLLSPYRLTGT